ncbi:hypothetical protein [Brevundimonas sp.]|uniref:hypothetical protein n=1 Tax=Brevundimonas sp. TaxID=1871086 RepID=UPI0025F469CB|nr:hypothetical protein [Brevundimonas sp.]
MYLPLSPDRITALTEPPAQDVALQSVRTVFASADGHVTDAVYAVLSAEAQAVITVPLRVAHFGDDLNLMIRPGDWHGRWPSFVLPADNVDEFGEIYFVRHDRLSRIEEIMAGVELDVFSQALAAFIADFLDAQVGEEALRLKVAAEAFAHQLRVTDAAA